MRYFEVTSGEWRWMENSNGTDGTDRLALKAKLNNNKSYLRGKATECDVWQVSEKLHVSFLNSLSVVMWVSFMRARCAPHIATSSSKKKFTSSRYFYACTIDDTIPRTIPGKGSPQSCCLNPFGNNFLFWAASDLWSICSRLDKVVGKVLYFSYDIIVCFRGKE